MAHPLKAACQEKNILRTSETEVFLAGLYVESSATVILPGHVLFALRSASLKTDALPLLDELRKVKGE